VTEPPQPEPHPVVLLPWDPSVRRSRLTYDIWTWLVPVGELDV
jgi:hypothetical protein